MREYHDGVAGLALICVDRIKILNKYSERWESENYRDAYGRYWVSLTALYRELFWTHGGIGDPGEPNDADETRTLRWLVEYQASNGGK